MICLPRSRNLLIVTRARLMIYKQKISKVIEVDRGEIFHHDAIPYITWVNSVVLNKSFTDDIELGNYRKIRDWLAPLIYPKRKL